MPKVLLAILQTVIASIIIACLVGIYEKLGKLDLIQDRQDRQGFQLTELSDIQRHQAIELSKLSASDTYQEDQIHRLQDRAYK